MGVVPRDGDAYERVVGLVVHAFLSGLGEQQGVEGGLLAGVERRGRDALEQCEGRVGPRGGEGLGAVEQGPGGAVAVTARQEHDKRREGYDVEQTVHDAKI